MVRAKAQRRKEVVPAAGHLLQPNLTEWRNVNVAVRLRRGRYLSAPPRLRVSILRSKSRTIIATSSPRSRPVTPTWPNGPDKPSEEVQVVCGAPNARAGLIGVLGLSAATGGYAFGPLNWPLRLALFCFSPLLDAAVLETSTVQRKNHVFSFLLAFSDGIRYDGETGTS